MREQQRLDDRLTTNFENSQLHQQQSDDDQTFTNTLIVTRTTQMHGGIGSRDDGGVLDYHLNSSSPTPLYESELCYSSFV